MSQTTEEKYQAWFSRGHLMDDLKGRSVSGGVNTVGAQLISFVLTIGSTAILARLLMPEDYGLVAMVTAVIGFVMTLKEVGLSEAIIQKESVNHKEVSALFWLNLMIGAGVAVVITGLSPAIASFYDEPRLYAITFAYAVMALVGSTSLQHVALLKRQMMFKALASITILSTVIGIIAALIMAYFDMGYWALVGLYFFNALSNAILAWVRCNWRPSLVKIDSSIKSYLTFGAHISGFNIINYFARNLDNILIGRFMGESILGLYDQAYRLLMIPITKIRDPLNSVSIPGLSALIKEKERYQSYYRKYVLSLAFFSMPVMAFLGVMSFEVIDLILGDKFHESARYFQALAVVSFIQPVASTRGVVMISAGLSKRYLYWGIINLVAVAIAFIIGIQYGVMGLIAGYALVNYGILYPSLRFCFSGTSVSVGVFFRAIALPTLYSILAALTAYFANLALGSLHSVWRILITGFLFSVVYLGLWFAFKGSREQLSDLTDILGKLAGGKLEKIKRKFKK